MRPQVGTSARTVPPPPPWDTHLSEEGLERSAPSDLPLDGGGVATLIANAFFALTGGAQLVGAGGLLTPLGVEPELPESTSTGSSLPALVNHLSTAACSSAGLPALIWAITRCCHSVWWGGLRELSRSAGAAESAHMVLKR